MNQVPTKEEYKKALTLARRKLNNILTREGNENVARLKPRYLAQLIAEEISLGRVTEDCFICLGMEKECIAIATHPLNNNHSIT